MPRGIGYQKNPIEEFLKGIIGGVEIKSALAERKQRKAESEARMAKIADEIARADREEQVATNRRLGPSLAIRSAEAQGLVSPEGTRVADVLTRAGQTPSIEKLLEEFMVGKPVKPPAPAATLEERHLTRDEIRKRLLREPEPDKPERTVEEKLEDLYSAEDRATTKRYGDLFRELGISEGDELPEDFLERVQERARGDVAAIPGFDRMFVEQFGQFGGSRVDAMAGSREKAKARLVAEMNLRNDSNADWKKIPLSPAGERIVDAIAAGLLSVEDLKKMKDAELDLAFPGD